MRYFLFIINILSIILKVYFQYIIFGHQQVLAHRPVNAIAGAWATFRLRSGVLSMASSAPFPVCSVFQLDVEKLSSVSFADDEVSPEDTATVTSPISLDTALVIALEL